jgi:lipopolysaccharide export system protein LptA
MTLPRFLELKPAARLFVAQLFASLLPATLLPALAFGLPDDAEQLIVVDSLYNELLFDQGLFVYRGTAEQPARITQGSLEISGIEIRLEKASDGSLRKVTVTGTPARFQQQPAADQEIVHASGLTIVFDNGAQLLTLDESAELSQAGNVLTHQHIEYNLETRSASSSGSNEAQGRMTFPAPVNSN